MSRHNRSTVRTVRRTQRPKSLRNLLDAESRAYRTAMDSWTEGVR